MLPDIQDFLNKSFSQETDFTDKRKKLDEFIASFRLVEMNMIKSLLSAVN